MRFRRSLRKLERKIEDELCEVAGVGAREARVVLRNVAWVSAGVTVLALGVVAGRELRQRYKFTRRTPYDFYAHSGDENHDLEFGVGI